MLFLGFVACAVLGAVAAPSIWVGILLVGPAALQAVAYGSSIIGGYPTTDEHEHVRLTGLLDGLRAPPTLRVFVQSQTRGPMSFRRGSTPAIIGALSFVRLQADNTVRAAAAVQIVALDDPEQLRIARRLMMVLAGMAAVVALAAAALAPAHWVAAVIASAGLSLWLAGIAGSIWSHLPSVRDVLARGDQSAGERLGDREQLARALRAMDAWYESRATSRGAARRWLESALQPIPSTFHLRERAQRLEP